MSMKDKQPGNRPRVYQQVRGSRIWWADANDGPQYHCKPCLSREEAFEQAARYAAGVFE